MTSDLKPSAIDAAADALWDYFCPGIRQTDDDRRYYRQGATAVLAAAVAGSDAAAWEREVNADALENLAEGNSSGAAALRLAAELVRRRVPAKANRVFPALGDHEIVAIAKVAGGEEYGPLTWNMSFKRETLLAFAREIERRALVPVPEVSGLPGVVLYFADPAQRDGVISAILDEMPSARARRVG